MKDKHEQDFFILQTLEVALIGLFSLVSVSIYSIILWSAATSLGVDEEDRWSFRRSIKAVTISAILQNIYQVIFLIAKTTNTFNLLESIETATKTAASFEGVDQLLYCIFVYMMVLCLMKPLVWPRLRFDTYIYIIATIPPALIAVIRFTLIFSRILDHSARSSVDTATSVIFSFLIYLVPMTIVLLSTVANSRRQPEHFMKVCCQRMGIIFSLHLALSALHYSLYSFVECHNYDYDIAHHQYVCTDHLTAAENFNQEENILQTILPKSSSTTSIPPNPQTTPTALNVSQIVLNILSQLFLPFIPASFLYTVRTILSE